MKTKENEVLELIHNSGLTRIEDDLVGLLKYSIRLHTHSLEESTLEIGISKIGGTPDLPVEMRWPEWHNHTISLYCANQAQLLAVPHLKKDKRLIDIWS